MPADKQPGALQGLVKAETALQMALALPAATFVGWGLGALLDHWLHTHWIFLAGIGLGAAAGFFQIIRIARQLMKSDG